MVLSPVSPANENNRSIVQPAVVFPCCQTTCSLSFLSVCLVLLLKIDLKLIDMFCPIFVKILYHPVQLSSWPGFVVPWLLILAIVTWENNITNQAQNLFDHLTIAFIRWWDGSSHISSFLVNDVHYKTLRKYGKLTHESLTRKEIQTVSESP